MTDLTTATDAALTAERAAASQALSAAQSMVGDLTTRLAADEAQKAALQASYDALVADEALDEQTIIALRAQIAALQPVEYREAVDFTQPNASGFWLPNGATGKGMDKTVYRVKANTSTHTGDGNNPCRVMRIGAMPGQASVAGPQAGNLTIEGTPQGHSYHGLTVGVSTNAVVHDVKVTGIPGTSSAPPGETISVQFWHADNPTLRDSVLDGRDSTGTPVAATLCGNPVAPNGGTFLRNVFRYSAVGFGVAMFQGTGRFYFEDCLFDHNRKNINIEDSKAATYEFVGCTFNTPTSVPYHMQVGSKTTSAVVHIRDPKPDSWPFQVRIFGAPQQRSDIHLWVGGTDVSADPSKLKLLTSG